MTAHVNFTALMRAARTRGWEVAEYETQGQFLLAQGALEGLQAHDGRDPFSPAARRNRVIRQLLFGSGGGSMADTFKVLVLERQ
jgi:SAM-dependent MidA family methyltransferase